jgi:hypothetical protein
MRFPDKPVSDKSAVTVRTYVYGLAYSGVCSQLITIQMVLRQVSLYCAARNM